MDYTDEQKQAARAELAKRELARRKGSIPKEEEDPGAYLDSLGPQEGSHPLRDIIIGLTHAGRNLHNFPHDIAQGFEQATAPIGQAFESDAGP